MRKSGRNRNGANGRRRANNAGTLELHHGKWRARWVVFTPQGKQIRRTKVLDAATRADARKALDALTGESGLMSAQNDLRRIKERIEGVRAELQRVEDAKPALALDDMFEAFEKSPSRPQKSGRETMHQYELQVGRFVEWMAAHYPEAREMRQVSKEVAADFLSDLGKQVSPNTYNKYVALLRAIWRTMGETARCTVNPWDGIARKMQSDGNGRRALTIEELTRVCSTLTGEMRVLFALGIYTGLRLGDCALMDWGTVDMARRVIVTTPRKTKKHKTVVEIPLHPALFGILDEIPARRRMGYIMPDMAATYERDTSAVAARIRRVFEAAGFETRAEIDGYSNRVAKIGFHSLRHSFVSLMGNAGAPLALVQSIVGHSNPMMTSHYFHARTDALANAVGKLPAITDGTPDADIIEADAVTTTPDTETRLQAFMAAFDALTADERKEAARWIAKRQRATA